MDTKWREKSERDTNLTGESCVRHFSFEFASKLTATVRTVPERTLHQTYTERDTHSVPVEFHGHCEERFGERDTEGDQPMSCCFQCFLGLQREGQGLGRETHGAEHGTS